MIFGSFSEIATFLLPVVVNIATFVRMEPASSIIEALGGPNAVAEIAGVHRTRVSNWMRPKDKGGTGGLIPFRHAPLLIEAARRRGISLSADDFLPKEPEPAHG